MTDDLKSEPVKLPQYFRIAVRELEGITRSTGSMFAGERNIKFFQHDSDWSVVQDSLFRLQTFRHRSEQKNVALLLRKYSLWVCSAQLTAIDFKNRQIVCLVNLLLVCQDLKRAGYMIAGGMRTQRTRDEADVAGNGLVALISDKGIYRLLNTPK